MSHRAVGRTGMAAARSESSPYLTRGRARCPYRAVGRTGKDGGALRGLALPAWRRTILWAIDPHPLFSLLAQSSSHRIHQDVADLFLFLPVITQPMVEKVPLPINSLLPCEVSFPAGDRP